MLLPLWSAASIMPAMLSPGSVSLHDHAAFVAGFCRFSDRRTNIGNDRCSVCVVDKLCLALDSVDEGARFEVVHVCRCAVEEGNAACLEIGLLYGLTVVLYGVMTSLIFFPNIKPDVASFLKGFCVAVMLVALILYIIFYINILTEYSK